MDLDGKERWIRSSYSKYKENVAKSFIGIGKIKPGDDDDDDIDDDDDNGDESFGAGRKKFGVRPLAGKQTLSPAEVSPADQKVEADMIKLNTRVEVKKPGKVFVWSYSKLKRIPETFIIYQLHSQDALMFGGNTIQMKKIFVSNHILC